MKTRFPLKLALPAFLALAHFAATADIQSAQPVVYVDAEQGNDSHTGLDEASAVQTLAKASELIAASGTIHLIPRKTPFRDPLQLRAGGQENAPLAIEGNGAVIDLGEDITDAP